MESLPTEPLTAAEVEPLGSRHDPQIAVFGRSIQDKLSNLNLFLVSSCCSQCGPVNTCCCFLTATAASSRGPVPRLQPNPMAVTLPLIDRSRSH